MAYRKNNNRRPRDDYNQQYGPPSQRSRNNFPDEWGSDPFYMISDSMQQMRNFSITNNLQQVPATIFTVNCGEIREKDDGCRVKISGKVIKRPRSERFLELKDLSGCSQLVAMDNKPEIQLKFQNIPNDAYITVIGTVQLRPMRFVNKSISTGSMEIVVEEVENVIMPILSNDSLDLQINKSRRPYPTTTKSRGITSIEYKKSASENIVQYFVNRKLTCGELTREDIGRFVSLVGWLDSKKHGKFLQLKDGYGLTQIIVDQDDLDMKQEVANAKDDSIVYVQGRVIARPPQMIRQNSGTGEIELIITYFKVLDPNEPYRNENGEEADESMEVEASQKDDEQQQEQVLPRPIEKPKVNMYTYRTHNCGELNESNVGQEVTLTGWLEFHRMRKFFTLRDGYGCTQVIIPDELTDSYNIEDIPYESVLKVTGLALARPIGMRNESMSTGRIEITMKSLTVLNESKKNLPLEVRNFNRAKENLRMEYRYLDLRFTDMQKNLRTRSKILMKMREYLVNKLAFVEVETPTLFRKTPGGAQEFVVPTRKAGKFYSLVQSPQQFKQLLMVGAIDRYFQIARCYRDESTRPDRQPEFTQLDIELSFTDRENIMSMIESLLVYCWPENSARLSLPFKKMSYDEAMEKYGTDKPDLRFYMELKNVTNLVSLNEDISKATPGLGSYAIVLKHPQSNIKNNVKKELKEIEKESNAQMVVSLITANDINEWIEGPLKNLFTTVVLKALAANLHLEPNDLLVIGFGKKVNCQTMMGRVRTRLYEDLEERGLVVERAKQDNNFLWVIDFPMFMKNDETNELESVHHPFTAPHPEDRNLLGNADTRLLARSLAYDLVLNGQEIGGGSVRIHEPKLQKYVFDEILKLDRNHLNHMLEALQSGAPPHGGIALGIDRLMSIICNTNSIRDVIAFPKNSEGRDPMSKAPCEISKEEETMYHIKVMDGDSK